MPKSMVADGNCVPVLSSIVVSSDDSPSMLTMSSMGTTAPNVPEEGVSTGRRGRGGNPVRCGLKAPRTTTAVLLIVIMHEAAKAVPMFTAREEQYQDQADPGGGEDLRHARSPRLGFRRA